MFNEEAISAIAREHSIKDHKGRLVPYCKCGNIMHWENKYAWCCSRQSKLFEGKHYPLFEDYLDPDWKFKLSQMLQSKYARMH